MLVPGYLGVAGTIGVGKSTFTEQLAEALGFEPALEEVENPYLPDFYRDMRAHVTKMQIWFLSRRSREHRSIVSRLRRAQAPGVVKDRTVWEDVVFARMFNRDGILTDLDYQTYYGLFEQLVLQEPVFPELLIHLDCKPETALARIRQRARPMELGIPLDYLKALHDAYLEFLGEMKGYGVRVLMLDWERFAPLPELVAQVRQALGRASADAAPGIKSYTQV